MYRYKVQLLTLVLVCVIGNSALARPAYKKAFEEKYGKVPGPAPAAIKAAGCNACHVPDKPKAQRNSYGEVLRDELGKGGWDGMNIPAGLKDPAKMAEIMKTFEKAMEAAEQVKDKDGKPYGEQIKAGKLP